MRAGNEDSEAAGEARERDIGGAGWLQAHIHLTAATAAPPPAHALQTQAAPAGLTRLSACKGMGGQQQEIKVELQRM